MKSLTLSVTQLNKYVKTLLEGDVFLSDVFVLGEISNLKFNISGHIYFSLKDTGASIDVALFKSSAARIRFVPENGMSVICRGRVSIYDKTGKYQLYAEDIQPMGTGNLAVAFEQLKNRLAAEGLFDKEHKKALPHFPSRIAVITSPTGAALQDILNILKRRYPVADVLICPVKVQGENSAKEMCRALDIVDDNQLADIIIIGRGGGSAEDLWEFNDENLARTIYKCTIPVISAVGHETDFTICDFVSDLRAPTPSAAAEIAVPDRNELLSFFYGTNSSLCTALRSLLEYKTNRYNSLIIRRIFRSPNVITAEKAQELDRAFSDLLSFEKKLLLAKRGVFEKYSLALSAYNPLSMLSRGYISADVCGAPLVSVSQIETGSLIDLTLKDGSAEAVIKKINKNKNKNEVI